PCLPHSSLCTQRALDSSGGVDGRDWSFLASVSALSILTRIGPAGLPRFPFSAARPLRPLELSLACSDHLGARANVAIGELRLGNDLGGECVHLPLTNSGSPRCG